MKKETRYQQIAREQRERKAARAERLEAELKQSAKDKRRAARFQREAKRERRYSQTLVSDHNLDPGDDEPDKPIY